LANASNGPDEPAEDGLLETVWPFENGGAMTPPGQID